MKRFFIGFLALVMAALMAFAAVGCAKKGGDAHPTTTPGSSASSHNDGDKHQKNGGADEKKLTQETDAPREISKFQPAVFIAKSEECFKGGGFASFAAIKDGEITVKIDPAGSDVGWQIFVLDDKFDDTLSLLPQAYQPVLEESGTITVKAGQYVYAYCMVNGFTADEPAEGSTVTFTGVGVPE